MATPVDDDPPTTVKRTSVIVVIVVVLVAGLGAGVMLSRTMGDQADSAQVSAESGAPTPESVPSGEAAVVDAMNINLAAGHYLRIGVAVQLVEGPSAEEWLAEHAAVVRHSTIEIYTGATMDVLETDEGREAARLELLNELQAQPRSDVIDVYLTDFVMR